MGKLIPLSRFRSELQPASTELSVEQGASPSERELWPMGAFLFVFSAARVAYAVAHHEPFDTEPTVALSCLLGLPLLGWIQRGKIS
jgi:hypothetical protein